MKYSLINQNPFNQKTDCLILSIAENSTFPDALKPLDSQLNGLISTCLKRGDIHTAVGDISWLITPDQKAARLLFVGIGKPNELTDSKRRKAITAGMSALCKSPADSAILVSSSLLGKEPTISQQHRIIEESVQAIEAARYQFDQCKSQKKKPGKIKLLKFATTLSTTLATTNVATTKSESSALTRTLTKARALAKGIQLAKDLGNLPGNICTPKYLAKKAKKLAENYPSLRTTVMGEKVLHQQGMHSLLSVAAGSAQPAQLITMEYNGGNQEENPHVLVGKGITFDSGGISLKPGAGMDEMKFDMCGAASVFGTITALAEMKAPINVVAVVAAAENMPGPKATKPGDIVTSLSGQTIEILNTDAEGRLVLCDALSYCKKFEPKTIIDIATLTGACIIALGHETAGLMANDDQLAEDLLNAGKKTGDRAWRLPLFEEYQTQLDSNFADMQNIGGRSAGTITAGCFLSRFTKEYRWAHLDIAGVAWHSGAKKGATGRPVALLTEYLLGTMGSD